MKKNESIDEVFAHALELQDRLERERYLESACSGNETVLIEVKRLLHLLPQMGSFIETPLNVSFIGAATGHRPSSDLTGHAVGPYHVISLKAHGGMGRVYLAQQDVPIRRRVAIKVIRNELANDEIVARFELERNVLSLMDHPNIARVLDAGTTGSGEPYFVMEWVDGDSITEFCKRKGIAVRERMGLLLTVCQAVQHAHQKGIIHRDLKPSNILVSLNDGKSTPKVIDFGIARATAESMLERDQMTGAGQIVGTLDYMAPEQADQGNLDIDIRADIYSLGAVAYELLAHSPPFAPSTQTQNSFNERLRRIRECDPEKPSRRLANSIARPPDGNPTFSNELTKKDRIDPDLDWIVLKCLEKDRGRRYETVVALAEDLERYLNGHPVLACPPTLRYRFCKFAKRYRNLLVLGTALGLVLMVSTIVSIVQAVRVNRLHMQSQSNLADAQDNLKLAIEAVDKFCTRVSDDLRMTKQDLRPLRRELLSTAVDFHQQLLERRGKSGMAKLDLARAHGRLAELSTEIDTPVQAENSYQSAINEFENLDAEQLGDFAVQYELALCWQRLSKIQLQNADTVGAQSAALRCTSIYQQLLVIDSESTHVQVALAETWLLQCAIAYAINDIDLADESIRQAIERWTEVTQKQPNHPKWLAQLAYAHARLGNNLKSRSLKRWREAEDELVVACELARRASKLTNASDFCLHVLAESLLDLGTIAKITGRPDESLKKLSEAKAILEEFHKSEPSVWSHAISLARCYHQLSSLHLLQASDQQAKGYLIREQELLEPLIGADSENTLAEVTMAETLHDLGNLSIREGNSEAGLGFLDQAVLLNENVLKREPELRVRTEQAPFTWRSRGRALFQLGRYDEAIHDYDLAIKNANPGFREQLRVDRSGVLIKVAKYREAMGELRETLLEAPNTGPSFMHASQLLRGAKLYVDCGSRAIADRGFEEMERKAIQDESYSEAIRLLRKARENGLENFADLKSASEFEPLKPRDDFQLLFVGD